MIYEIQKIYPLMLGAVNLEMAKPGAVLCQKRVSAVPELIY